MKINFSSFFFILCFIACGQKIEESKLHNGDIIFQSSQSGQSKAVQLATHSKYSHVGLIYIENKKTYVLEAVQPVKKTLLSDWIKHGDGEKYVVKRLKSNSDVINSGGEKIITEYRNFDGKNYDIYFGWSDKEIYCSELVWKIYKQAFDIELCELRKLKSFDLSSKEVKQIMEKRYGDKIPYDEDVVAPSDLDESILLETVFKN